MATLRDVALEAGVHLTTASSILNGSSKNSRFSEQTRQRVTQAAKRLGYAQNLIARSLRTRRTNTVGLVAGNIQNPFFAALTLQLERHLQERGYHLVFTSHGADASLDESMLATLLLARSVDGLLIWSEQREGRTPRLPKGSKIPQVWMGHGPRAKAAVTIDIAAGLALALAHAQSLGCRRIAYYAPSYAETAGLPRSRPSLLDEACAAAGIAKPTHMFFPGQSWNLDAAVRYALNFAPVLREKRIDAVIAYNDVSAVGWQIAARESGFTCPVIGFDGSPLIRAWRPTLPFVDLHGDTLAQAAVDLLIELIEHRQPPQRRVLVHPTFVAPTV